MTIVISATSLFLWQTPSLMFLIPDNLEREFTRAFISIINGSERALVMGFFVRVLFTILFVKATPIADKSASGPRFFISFHYYVEPSFDAGIDKVRRQFKFAEMISVAVECGGQPVEIIVCGITFAIGNFANGFG